MGGGTGGCLGGRGAVCCLRCWLWTEGRAPWAQTPHSPIQDLRSAGHRVHCCIICCCETDQTLLVLCAMCVWSVCLALPGGSVCPEPGQGRGLVPGVCPSAYDKRLQRLEAGVPQRRLCSLVWPGLPHSMEASRSLDFPEV